MVWVFSSVFQNVHFQVVNSICCKVAHCALVRFLPSVNENVCLQIAFYIERLVALWAHVFLGPRGPLVLPSVGPSVCPVRPARKIWITYIQRYMCLMNHEKTHQTNPKAPWDPLDALLTPWDPLATPQSTPSDP